MMSPLAFPATMADASTSQTLAPPTHDDVTNDDVTNDDVASQLSQDTAEEEEPGKFENH